MPAATPPERSAGRHALVSHSAYIFLIRFFPALASLVVLILFPRLLPSGVYGSYQNFWTQWSVLHAVACLGLPAFLMTYPAPELHQFLLRLGRRRIAAIAGWVLAAGGCFAVLQGRSGPLPVWLPVAFLPVHAGIAVLESYLVLSRRFRYLAGISVGYSLLFLLVHGLVLQRLIELPQLFLILLLLGACRLLLYWLPARRLFRSARFPGLQDGTARMRRLWLHLGLYDVSQTLFRWLDKFIVSLLVPPALSGLYFIGTVDIPFLLLLLGAVGGSLLLQMGSSDETDAGRLRLLRYSSARLGEIVFPLFFFLLAFRYELFHVVFSGKYDGAVPLFLVSILVVPLRCYNFTALLQHKGAGALINKGALLDLLTALALVLPLYRLMGLQGIALAFVISTWCQAGYYLYHTARLMQCPASALVPWRHWLKGLIVFSTGFIGLHYILTRFFNPVITLILGGGVWLAALLLALVPLFFSKRNAHGPAAS